MELTAAEDRLHHAYRCFVDTCRSRATRKAYIDKVLLADLEARLSIFFSDFVYDYKHEPVIRKPPAVDINKLEVAINKLKKVVNNYCLP